MARKIPYIFPRTGFLSYVRTVRPQCVAPSSFTRTKPLSSNIRSTVCSGAPGPREEMCGQCGGTKSFDIFRSRFTAAL